MEKSHLPVEVQQFSRYDEKNVVINAAIEAPVTLFVNGASWLTFQCTPTEIESLALGFLYNEGFINSPEEIESMHLCVDGTTIDIWLNHLVEKPETWHRSTGCFNGLSTDERERKTLAYLNSDRLIAPHQVFELIDLFMDQQIPRSTSGGIHTSALADGKIIILQLIDIGRHNTFDKLAGRMLLDDIKVDCPSLITTGRVSSELVIKSVIMRAPLLISLRSASQSAVSLADQWGITLISGANRSRFNLLTHPERVKSV